MPQGCALLEQSRHDPDFGTNLEFFHTYTLTSQRELARNANDRVFVEFVLEARKVRESHIGIEHRHLFFGRRWDMLYYLLSENRRRGERKDWSNWVEKRFLEVKY